MNYIVLSNIKRLNSKYKIYTGYEIEQTKEEDQIIEWIKGEENLTNIDVLENHFVNIRKRHQEDMNYEYRCNIMWRKILELPYYEKKILYDYYISGKNMKQTADNILISVKNLREILCNIKTKMRKETENLLFEETEAIETFTTPNQYYINRLTEECKCAII